MGLIAHKGIIYGGGIDAISDASDVAITTPADKNLLEYDATQEKWVNVENPFSIVNGALCVTFEQVDVESLSDTTPYLYRKSPAIGTRVMEKALVGASVVRNQLVQIADSDKSKTENGVTIVDNRDGTYTVSTDANGATADVYISLPSFNAIANHVYFICGTPAGGSTAGYNSYISGLADSVKDLGYGRIGKQGSTRSVTPVPVYVKSGTIITTPIKFRQQAFDLTQLFGSDSIPDNANAKETAQSYSGIAWLKDNGFDFSKYISYNTGTLESVDVTGKEVVGKNQFDEIYTGIKTDLTYKAIYVGNGQFTMSTTAPKNNNSGANLFLLEGNVSEGASTTSNGVWSGRTRTVTAVNGYVTVGYRNVNGVDPNDYKTQIEFGAPATAYVPYEKHTYPIPETTLRGLFKLVNDSIVADGDRLESDGTHSVKYDEVDLGTLEWTRNTSYTYPFFSAPISNMKMTTEKKIYYLSNKYISLEPKTMGGSNGYGNNSFDKTVTKLSGTDNHIIMIQDTDYTDATTFTTAISGIKFYFEKDTVSTEQLAPFDNLQISIVGGTEEYITNTDVPVGHESEYKRLPVMFEDDYIQTLQSRVENPRKWALIYSLANGDTLPDIDYTRFSDALLVLGDSSNAYISCMYPVDYLQDGKTIQMTDGTHSCTISNSGSVSLSDVSYLYLYLR